ncbi:MAG: hypothetical protein JWL59_2288 [Chthoniobacteraceae bacterium]|nr:hypothetical protein [Chthoniobacteraceae bacterium]
MKIKTISLTLLLAASAYAESPYELELKQLDAQHSKAISAAVDPINQRYRAALEQLLRRATQGNDLDGALKIREVLGSLSSSGTQAVLDKQVRDPVLGRWFFPDSTFFIELRPDGSAKTPDTAGAWKAIPGEPAGRNYQVSWNGGKTFDRLALSQDGKKIHFSGAGGGKTILKQSNKE